MAGHSAEVVSFVGDFHALMISISKGGNEVKVRPKRRVTWPNLMYHLDLLPDAKVVAKNHA